VLDTTKSIETPEGIELVLRPAGPLPRALAWALDLILRFVLYMALLMLLVPFGGTGMGLFLVAMFLLEWLYPVLFEVLWKGQTPGKRALGLRVLRSDGTPVGWGASLLRSLLMTADFLPVGYAAGLVSMLLQRDCRRLGDLAAGTLVVYAEERIDRVAMVTDSVTPEAPAVPLQLDEQQAIATFGERTTVLSPERVQELADLLEPLTGSRGAAGVARLRGIAAYVTGGR
jgi:uncharacterized RDD family membrane protein YckC